MTGDVKWKSPGRGQRVPLRSRRPIGRNLYMRYADGTMTLVKASPDGFEEVNSFTVPGSGDRPSWSHPVIADGNLYLRESDAILCYDIHK